MSDTKLTGLTALASPVSADKVYIVDVSDLTDSSAGSSRSTTLSLLSKGIVVTSLDITGLTASQLIRLNSGGTALESSGKTVPTGTIVGTTDSQTLTTKTIDGDDNTLSDIALTSLKTVLADASKFVVRDASGIPVSNTKAVPSGVVVGTTDTQALTNKDMTDSSNTFPNSLGATEILRVASSAVLPTTNPAALIKTIGTNNVYLTLDYDKTTEESAYWEVILPQSYTGAATFYGYYKTSVNSGTFGVKVTTKSIADAEVFDAAGTTDTITAETVPGTAGNLGVISGSLTVTGWAAGEILMVQVARDVANDNANADISLLGWRIDW